MASPSQQKEKDEQKKKQEEALDKLVNKSLGISDGAEDVKYKGDLAKKGREEIRKSLDADFKEQVALQAAASKGFEANNKAVQAGAASANANAAAAEEALAPTLKQLGEFSARAAATSTDGVRAAANALLDTARSSGEAQKNYLISQGQILNLQRPAAPVAEAPPTVTVGQSIANAIASGHLKRNPASSGDGESSTMNLIPAQQPRTNL